jgi:radical SAM protein with 4Fe4S-binding SPASM domain
MKGLTAPSILERAFFAGYFDAEGCIRVGRRHACHWYARVAFQQNDPTVITKLRAFYGGAFYARGRKTTWQLDRFAALACFLTDIQPYVREKAAQIALVLTRFASAMAIDAGKSLMRDLTRDKHTARVKPSHASKRAKRAICTKCSCIAVCRGLCGAHYQAAKRTNEFVTGPRNKVRPFNYRRPPTVIELAYLAGYFDGDGNVDIMRVQDTRHVRITFEQCCPDAVQFMHEIYGGTLRYCVPKKKTHRPSLRYVIAQQEAALAFLRDLQPHMLEKRDEADLVLTGYSNGAARAQLATRLKQLRHTPLEPVGTVDVRTFITTLADCLTKKPSLLTSKTAPLGEAIGWFDERYVYLVSDRARHLVEMTRRDRNEAWITSPRLLHRALQQGKYLAPSKQSRPVIAVQLAGGVRRVLKIPRSTLVL